MLKTFPRGGVHPDDSKISANSPIKVSPLPNKVYVMLNQSAGAPAIPLVKKGDHIKTGQLIAKGEAFISANIHSPVTGIVDKIDQISSVISHIFPERSFTISDVEGSFSGSNRKQITLILSQEEMPVLLNSLNSIDEKFFLYYNQVDGIVGRFMYSKF